MDQVQYGGDAGLKSLIGGAGVVVGGMIAVKVIGNMVRSVPLALPPGGPKLIIPGKLQSHELAQVERIISFRGGTFVGPSTRNFAGIDGTIDGIGASLKQYTGTSPLGVLKHASKAEEQAFQAGYTSVELFIDARNVKAGPLLDFARKGPLAQIPRQGVISTINIETADGWVRLIP